MSENGFWKNSSPHMILAGVVVAACAAIAFAFLADSNGKQIKPTDPNNPRWAVMHEPEQVEQMARHKAGLRKSRGPILAELSSDLSGPATAGTRFKLRGIVNLKENVAELHYHFDLPKDVRVIDGDVTGVIYDASVSDTHEIEVTVESIKNLDTPLRFRAWKMAGKESVGNSASLKFDSDSLQALGTARVPSGKAPRSPEEFQERAIH